MAQWHRGWVIGDQSLLQVLIILLLSAGYSDKHFTCIASFNSHLWGFSSNGEGTGNSKSLTTCQTFNKSHVESHDWTSCLPDSEIFALNHYPNSSNTQADRPVYISWNKTRDKERAIRFKRFFASLEKCLNVSFLTSLISSSSSLTGA